MNMVTRILGSRTFGIICFLFAIANRVIFTSVYSLIGLDTKLQLTYAQNIIDGKGIGLTKYFTNNLSTPVFDTQQEFPQGFSIFIVPFLKIFGRNEYRAVMAYDIVIAICFVILVRIAGKKVGLIPFYNNILTLVAGSVQFIFFMSWTSTEAVAVCLLLFSMIQTISLFNKKKPVSLLRCAAYGFLFFLPFFFRYLYLPVTIFFPFFIFFSGVIIKNSRIKISGLKIMFFSFLFLALHFSLSILLAGNALYSGNTDHGFFINQVLYCYPFLPASIINLDFAAQLIYLILKVDHGSLFFWLTILNPFLLVLLLYLFFNYVRKNKISLLHSNYSIFIVMGSLVCIIILLALFILTFFYKGQLLGSGSNLWVYISEPRYFSYLYIFILFLLFICLQYFRTNFKHQYIRFSFFLILCILAIEVSHGIYYNIKTLITNTGFKHVRNSDRNYNSFPSILNEIKARNSGREIIISSPNKYYLYFSSQLGYTTIFDFSNILQKGLTVSSKSLLVIPIQSQEINLVKEYIEKRNTSLIFAADGTYFYIQEINPQ